MPVELRKRKAPPPPPAPAPKKQSKASKVVSKAKDAVKGKPAAANGMAKPAVGDTITLQGFGGAIQTHEGEETTLQTLVDESKSGVVIFTYPKASTPGCTNQVCFFRDSYEALTKDGLAIYGMSADSPKANSNFKEKKNLPYPLLCDTDGTLLGALGLKKPNGGANRAVFAVDKAGKVLLLQEGGPKATLEAVEKLVEESAGGEAKPEEDDKAANGKPAEDKEENEAEEEKGPEEEKKEDKAEKTEEKS